jgi:FMN phosphatase YigB (HAD superfamily)
MVAHVLDDKRAGPRALTNGQRMTARLLRAAALEGVVGRVMSVDDMGEWKPALPAPAHGGVLRLEPGQLAMVAVHAWDVHGAVRAGFTAAWGPASRAPTRRRSTRRTFPVATSWRSSRGSWH